MVKEDQGRKQYLYTGHKGQGLGVRVIDAVQGRVSLGEGTPSCKPSWLVEGLSVRVVGSKSSGAHSEQASMSRGQ